MKLEKAKKDIQARIDGEFAIKGKDNCEDLKLGREAIIFKQAWQKGQYFRPDYLLPGETKE